MLTEEEAVITWKERACGNALYFPLNFAVSLTQLLKKKSINYQPIDQSINKCSFFLFLLMVILSANHFAGYTVLR